MSYQHIENLYKLQHILLFRWCYALEKIHGTSAHLTWTKGELRFSSGGEKHDRFVALFDRPRLTAGLEALGHEHVTVYGEAYGGKQQGQSWRYGPILRFVAFEVRIGESWLAVPAAERVVLNLGLEFVHYRQVATDLVVLDAERDAPSEQARRNGVEGNPPREGVVLRPPLEVVTNNGERILAKHKRNDERETKTPRRVVDPAALAVLTRATEIAEEWVTPTRLDHVLDKLGGEITIERTRDVIAAMTEDVVREARNEIVENREMRIMVGRRTAELFRKHVQTMAREAIQTKLEEPQET